VFFQFRLHSLALGDVAKKYKQPLLSFHAFDTDLNINNSAILASVTGFETMPVDLHYLSDARRRLMERQKPCHEEDLLFVSANRGFSVMNLKGKWKRITSQGEGYGKISITCGIYSIQSTPE
jgi:hypothetical protein